MSKKTLPDISIIIKTGDALEQRTYSYLHKAQNKAKSGEDFSRELAECLSALKDFTDYNEKALDEVENSALIDNDLKFVDQIVNSIRQDREKRAKSVQSEVKKLQKKR